MDQPPVGSHSVTNQECQSHHSNYQHNLLAERANEREGGNWQSFIFICNMVDLFWIRSRICGRKTYTSYQKVFTLSLSNVCVCFFPYESDGQPTRNPSITHSLTLSDMHTHTHTHTQPQPRQARGWIVNRSGRSTECLSLTVRGTAAHNVVCRCICDHVEHFNCS